MRSCEKPSPVWWRENYCRLSSMLRKLRVGLGFVILAISILILAWGTWPAHREIRVQPASEPAGLGPPGQRALTLDFPPQIRVGEPGVVRLVLHTNEAHASTGEDADASDFYETHTVIAEARFDIPGMNVRPSELISAPISQGQDAVFYWTLRPGQVGQYRGTIWVYLRTVDKLTGQENRETVAAQIVGMESVKLLGLAANGARTAGLVGVVIGLFLSLPFFDRLARNFGGKRAESHKIG